MAFVARGGRYAQTSPQPPPPWEPLSQAEAKRLLETSSSRYSAAYRLTTPADVLALFSPLTGCVSTGVLAVDALLTEASSSPNQFSGKRWGEGGVAGVGGWTTGSLNEVYGPPMCGKSFLLQRTALAFIRKQRLIASEHGWAQLQSGGGGDDNGGASLPVTHNAHSWRLYLCLVTAGNESAPTGDGHGPTALERCWAQLLASATGPATGTASGPAADPCDAAAKAAVHVVSLTHPNELLSFLSWLARDLDRTAAERESAGEGKREVRRGRRPAHSSKTSSPTPSQVRGKASAVSLTPTPTVTTAAGGSSKARSRDARKRPRSLTPTASSPSPPREPPRGSAKANRVSPVPPAPTAPSQKPPPSFTHHHQTLLLLDSLAHVWQHPSLQGSKHSVRWYSSELQRLLRHCLCRRQARVASCHPGSWGGCPSPPPQTFLMTTTAVVANGSTRFLNDGFVSQRQQLQVRRPPPQRGAFPACVSSDSSTFVFRLGDDGKGRGAEAQEPRAAVGPLSITASTAFDPRCSDGEERLFPFGDEAWQRAPDVRLLLRPAEHSLLSLSANHGVREDGDNFSKGKAKRSLVVPVPVLGQPVTRVDVVAGGSKLSCVVGCIDITS